MAAKGRGTRFPENRRKKKVRRVPNRTSARAPSRSSKRRQVRSGVPCCNSRPRGSRSRSSTSARRGSVAGKGNKKEKKNEKKNEKKKRRKQKRARARAHSAPARSLSLSLSNESYIYISIYIYIYIYDLVACVRGSCESRALRRRTLLSLEGNSREGVLRSQWCVACLGARLVFLPNFLLSEQNDSPGLFGHVPSSLESPLGFLS